MCFQSSCIIYTHFYSGRTLSWEKATVDAMNELLKSALGTSESVDDAVASSNGQLVPRNSQFGNKIGTQHLYTCTHKIKGPIQDRIAGN